VALCCVARGAEQAADQAAREKNHHRLSRAEQVDLHRLTTRSELNLSDAYSAFGAAYPYVD
jgi:hypothetical protein